MAQPAELPDTDLLEEETEATEKGAEKVKKAGSNSRNRQALDQAPIHRWVDGQKVKIPTLCIRYSSETLPTEINGKFVGPDEPGNPGNPGSGMNLAQLWGLHVVKILENEPLNTIDFPSKRSRIHAGHKYFLLPKELVEPEATRGAPCSNNDDLVNIFRDCYTTTTEGRQDTAQLQKGCECFAEAANYLGLYDLRPEQIECKHFDCFQVEYPADAPEAWIGAPAACNAPFAAGSDTRAMNMRYEFGFSPVAVCRAPHDGPERRYVLPATARTVVCRGDLLIFLVPGGPGSPYQGKRDLHPATFGRAIKKLLSRDYLWELPHAYLETLPHTKSLPLQDFTRPAGPAGQDWADCMDDDDE
ncbi:unnamed protein product [Polarella glacialis]|uniref:Uncharacterized protein n=1 Tax=Polarella glacialis TaxID=89957 RepID=A0A813IA48_POLGL|nr:unnamed protein product [Polarella glacialis]CAE8647611.1 unnamed protein product [Polarella glacialis]